MSGNSYSNYLVGGHGPLRVTTNDLGATVRVEETDRIVCRLPAPISQEIAEAMQAAYLAGISAGRELGECEIRRHLRLAIGPL